jgi:predicted transcriptional regulator
MDAGLDTKTQAKLEALAIQFNQSRAAMLRPVLRWGLRRELTGMIDDTAPSPVQHLFFIVDVDLHQQVKAAAQAAGVDVAPWLRHMMRQITKADFLESWQAGKAGRRHASRQRSHDSRHYWKRFMLRLDDQASARLDALASHPFRHPGPLWPVPANLPENLWSIEERVRVTPSPAQFELPLWVAGWAGRSAAARRGV